jgi:hypothetical protein
MFKSKIMPSRTSNALGKSKSVADLDAMLVEPVAFKVLNKEHVIAPLSVEQFFKVTAAWSELDTLRDTKEIPVEFVLDKYYEVISAAVSTITREDMNQMSIQQIGAILQLVVETVTGKIFAEKKTMMPINTAQN